MKNKSEFSFEISLSVLNHLGRNLYRSFATVLGEAISNAWDADAKNVWIYINKKKQNFFIKDDGVGMSALDFQNKLLRIGYTKRKSGNRSKGGRPYIGRKGIGKLALLSCAEKITIISKDKPGDYIGGIIDNAELDKAITDDLTPKEYPLGPWEENVFKQYTKGHKHGTIIHFQNFKDGIRNSLYFIKQLIALNFKFSLLDPSFNIFVNDEKITHECLKELAEKTEFLWTINKYTDPYIKDLVKGFTPKRNERKNISTIGTYTGFIGSVEKPRNLKIVTTDERLGIDLFVNGRLRERDILKHIPTSRVAENYLYGQIHFNLLDDGIDRFTSSREGIVADDPKYNRFLSIFRKKIILKILEDWDKWRIKHRKEGDSENTRISRRERTSRGLFNAVSDEYSLPEDSKNKRKVDGWVDSLAEDAQYNFGSYAECFVSENLIRAYIVDRKIPLSPEAESEFKNWKDGEDRSKLAGNIHIQLRRIKSKLTYLSMGGLANLVDRKDASKGIGLPRDAKEYKPIRDAVAHTALLTDTAKHKLTAVYQNIKARIKVLLS